MRRGYDLDSSIHQPLVRQEVQVNHRQIQKNHYKNKNIKLSYKINKIIIKIKI